MAYVEDKTVTERRPGDPPGDPCPPDVEKKVKRGRQRAQQLAPKRNECVAFFRNRQYAYVTSENELRFQATAVGTAPDSKPQHRARTIRNFITPMVRQEVSYATQRVPSYQVVPSKPDQPTQEAARVAEKVALFGYDAWKIRNATVRVVTDAIVADEGFAWPYWDPTIGTPIDTDGTAQGDVRVRTFGPNEVYWEPGIRFEDSRWHVVEQAESPESVMERPGYLGGDLACDAKSSPLIGRGDVPSDAHLVLVTEYLERPCQRKPEGRRIVMANGRQIFPTEPYPLLDQDGEPLDEPVLHKLSVITDPQSDRDMGLVRFVLDAQRTFNAMHSKSLEWAVMALNPQIVLQNVVLKQSLNDVPGAVIKVYGSGQVGWRPVPPVPGEIFEIADRSKADAGFVFSQNDLPDNVDTARGIQALIDRDQNARADFLASLAEFHSRVMRHCLYLVARHYTEERTLDLNGDFGWENIQNFLGAHLRSQCSVRVFPDSLEPKTKQAIEQRVMNYAQLGWISPEAAMAAIDNGSAQSLVDSYERDVARAWWVIQLIRQGPDALFSLQPNPPNPGLEQQQQQQAPPTNPDGSPVIDEATGQPAQAPLPPPPEEQPGWMPRWFDNEKVHKQVFEDWMKSRDWDVLPMPMRDAATMYYQALLQQEAAKQQQAAEAQAAQAEQLGMQNASRPQNKPNPSLPSLSGSSNGSSDQQQS